MVSDEQKEDLVGLKLPFETERLLQVRTGKIKPLYHLPVKSAIYKNPHARPVKVTKLGCEGDEHAYEFHGGPDKALLHYCARHYETWKAECPGSEKHFTVGGFGENLVSTSANEQNICIGDILTIGPEVTVQVSLPRQPCFKLNHRFEVKDMAWQSQMKSRTGWYYRVLKEGYISPGDEIKLVERLNPKWTVAAVQHYLYREMKNFEVMAELVSLPGLGGESLTIFENRLKKNFENQDERMFGDDSVALEAWSNYKLVQKLRQTPRICSFVFEIVGEQSQTTSPKVEPGSHVRLKLGDKGDLIRAYSVVGGTKDRFELGVALADESRGGSLYLHKNAKVGDVFSVGKITTSFPLAPEADEHILIAGGIGITAFIPTAEKLKESGENFTLHLAVRSTHEVPFRERLSKLGKSLVIYDKERGRRLDLARIMSKVTTNTHVYCCGSPRLMDDVAATAKRYGLAEEQIHFEAFAITTSGDPFTAALLTSQKTIQVPATRSLLEALREAGIDVPSSCEAGSCGTCRVQVAKGRIDHRGTGLLESDKASAMLACSSRGIGHIELEL
jgi:MOSC domain-containing protein YiiM/ferredoxin-NADP reductase